MIRQSNRHLALHWSGDSRLFVVVLHTLSYSPPTPPQEEDKGNLETKDRGHIGAALER